MNILSYVVFADDDW